MVRVSPGSPSQWIATCSPCPASTCRSTQFTATFNSPSANHFACGASDQSSTWVNGVAQVSRFACSAQNAIRVGRGPLVRLRRQVRVRRELRRRRERPILGPQIIQRNSAISGGRCDGLATYWWDHS